MEWDVNLKQPFDVPSQEQMQDARKLIEAELDHKEVLDASMWQIISNCSSELIRHRGRFTRLSNLNRSDQIEALSEYFKVFFKIFCHLRFLTFLLKKMFFL